MRPRLGSGKGPGRCEREGELGLDVGDQVAVVVLELRAVDLEGVERVTAARGVHLGVENVEAGTVEVTADACEQVGLIGRVHEHLQAFAQRRQARTHDRLRGAHVLVQRAGVPCDVAGVVAREVAQLQRFPQGLFGAGGQKQQVQCMARFELARFDFGVHVGPCTTERAQRQAVQVFEQFALPRVPDLRAGAANVGHRQQVQRREITFVADLLGERLDHVGLGQVFFLRDARHGQVLLDQELDQLRVFAIDTMVAAKTPRFLGPEFGMVAAATLGHVMEQCGNVQHPGFVEGRRQLRTERVFVCMFRNEKAAHIAQHHDDVLIDRVHVEQVVLHLPDDAPEHPQVTPQHAGLVHQPERVGLALGFLQYLHEGFAVHRVVAKRRVHQVACVVERTQRARRQALGADGLLVDQEGFENGVWVALVQIVADHFEHSGALEELVVDGAHRRILRTVDALFDVEHQDLVELRHRLGGPVVALHQHF
jgi:hypothetical protein